MSYNSNFKPVIVSKLTTNNLSSSIDIPVAGPDYTRDLYVDFLEGALITSWIICFIIFLFYLTAKYPTEFNNAFLKFKRLPRLINFSVKKFIKSTVKLFKANPVCEYAIKNTETIKSEFDRDLQKDKDDLISLIKNTIAESFESNLKIAMEKFDLKIAEVKKEISDVENDIAYMSKSIESYKKDWENDMEYVFDRLDRMDKRITEFEKNNIKQNSIVKKCEEKIGQAVVEAKIARSHSEDFSNNINNRISKLNETHNNHINDLTKRISEILLLLEKMNNLNNTQYCDTSNVNDVDSYSQNFESKVNTINNSSPAMSATAHEQQDRILGFYF